MLREISPINCDENCFLDNSNLASSVNHIFLNMSALIEGRLNQR